MNIKVEYDGQYPNACSGNLKVIEDEKVIFETKDFSFTSTGSVSFTKDCDEVICGGSLEWNTKEYKRFLDFLNKHPKKDYIISEAERVIDDVSVCCGGCV